jgi:chromosome segregation ATPase
MSGNLEEKLGELTGTLRALTPALERLEDRQRENENELRTAIANLKTARSTIEALEKTAENLRNRLDIAQATILRIGDQVSEVLSSQKGSAKAVWDVVKIGLAAVAGALMTRLI